MYVLSPPRAPSFPTLGFPPTLTTPEKRQVQGLLGLGGPDQPLSPSLQGEQRPRVVKCAWLK